MPRSESAVIMVVEDDPTMAWVLSKVIVQIAPDCNVKICTDGQEALAYLSQHSVHCVITDYLMPHMSGLTLASSITTQWPTIPIVLITGGKVEQIRDEAQAAGCMIVLQKPVLPVHLQAIMQSLLVSTPTRP